MTFYANKVFVLYCIVLYCIVLYCIVLYCIDIFKSAIPTYPWYPRLLPNPASVPLPPYKTPGMSNVFMHTNVTVIK